MLLSAVHALEALLVALWGRHSWVLVAVLVLSESELRVELELMLVPALAHAEEHTRRDVPSSCARERRRSEVAVAQRAGRRVDVHSCSCYRGRGVVRTRRCL